MKTLRRFLAVTLMAMTVFIWTGCEEDEDPTATTAPFLGRAWMPVSDLFITNGVSASVGTGF